MSSREKHLSSLTEVEKERYPAPFEGRTRDKQNLLESLLPHGARFVGGAGGWSQNMRMRSVFNRTTYTRTHTVTSVRT